MDEGLQLRKIIVDSRTATVGTGSEFSVQLPETLNIPRNYGVYVTDVCLTHSFRTIHGGTSVGAKNQFVYFLERLYYGPDDYIMGFTRTSGHYVYARAPAASLRFFKVHIVLGDPPVFIIILLSLGGQPHRKHKKS